MSLYEKVRSTRGLDGRESVTTGQSPQSYLPAAKRVRIKRTLSAVPGATMPQAIEAVNAFCGNDCYGFVGIRRVAAERRQTDLTGK